MTIKIPAATVKEIKVLVQVNDHGTAYFIAAQALGCIDLAKRFQRINHQHMKSGYLSSELNYERHSIYEKMLSFARKNMAPADYKELYSVT